MIASLLSWVVVAAVVAFVGWPLVRRAATGDGTAAEVLPPLERQKLEAYAAIKEAEFDRRMGKLSEDDFTALTQRYRQQALAAMAAIEQARRAADAPRRSARSAPVRFVFCPSCGERLAPRANFCSACGRASRESAA